MDIREEKAYCYQIMNQITQDRRKLGEEYQAMRERLHKLDELELMGLDKVGVKGYFELLNDRNKNLAINNISREIEYQKKIQNLEDNKQEYLKPEENEFVPKEEITKDKEQELDKDQSDKRVDFDQVLMAIIATLKDNGAPMALPDLHAEVEKKMERKINVKNFRANIIQRAVEREPRVSRASRGYYQYNYSTANIHS